MTHSSSHFFDSRHEISTKKTPNVHAGKPATVVVGMALVVAIAIGFYSLNSKGNDTPSGQTSVAHVRAVWH